MNDGDYVSGSINQHGKLNVSILNNDGALLRRFPGPSEDAKRQFAFAAEGSGSYSIVIANPGDQLVKYELLIEKILSLNERLQPEMRSDPYPSPRIQALRKEIEAGNSTEAFWKEMAARGTPLVEPFGRRQASTRGFLWRGLRERNGGTGSVPDPVARILQCSARSFGRGIDLEVPTGARFTFAFSNDPMTWDDPGRHACHEPGGPNPNRILPGGEIAPPLSSRISVAELHMPPQPWTTSKPDTSSGSKGSLKSTIQGIDRTFCSSCELQGRRPRNQLVLFDAGLICRTAPRLVRPRALRRHAQRADRV